MQANVDVKYRVMQVPHGKLYLRIKKKISRVVLQYGAPDPTARGADKSGKIEGAERG